MKIEISSREIKIKEGGRTTQILSSGGTLRFTVVYDGVELGYIRRWRTFDDAPDPFTRNQTIAFSSWIIFNSTHVVDITEFEIPPSSKTVEEKIKEFYLNLKSSCRKTIRLIKKFKKSIKDIENFIDISPYFSDIFYDKAKDIFRMGNYIYLVAIPAWKKILDKYIAEINLLRKYLSKLPSIPEFLFFLKYKSILTTSDGYLQISRDRTAKIEGNKIQICDNKQGVITEWDPINFSKTTYIPKRNPKNPFQVTYNSEYSSYFPREFLYVFLKSS